MKQNLVREIKKVGNLFIITILFLFCSCSKESERELCFIGDSMIANWDVEESFPNRITRNWGKDGSHADILGTIYIPDSQSDIVILVGINDLYSNMPNAELNTYCDKYANYVCRINAERIFLISILPTSDKDKNMTVYEFNAKMKIRLKQYDNIVFVNCYKEFLNNKGLIKEGLTRDGIHLNDYGYMLLTDNLKIFL